MAGLTLYHYWRSSASWRVRWALELKGIAFMSVPVNLLAGEEKALKFLQCNPAGYVPCLVVEENNKKHFLAESLPIIEWLEENYPGPNLLPKNSFDRALARQLAEKINAGTQPLHNLDVYKKYSSDKDEQEEWIRHWISRGLGVYESILQHYVPSVKAYSIGDNPSIADLCLIPQCYSALRFQVDLAQFPRCKSIYEFAMETPECKSASAEAHKPKNS